MPEIPPPRTTFFLDALMDIRGCDTASGGTLRKATRHSQRYRNTVASLGRSSEALHAILTLLQASERCRRREPEDFGIGEDLHEGLLYAARELVAGLRGYADAIELATFDAER